MYDISNRDSFDVITYWFEKINNDIDLSNTPILLIGNKIDLRDKSQKYLSYDDDRQLIRHLVKDLSNEEKLVAFIETSASTGENVDQVFNLHR